ncbi:hypothetical protein HDU97_003230 [Phlyctochytrium planicorne]|nr:hypothetical protein HDU97_003230 [Phlyctochytrium planicorne]
MLLAPLMAMLLASAAVMPANAARHYKQRAQSNQASSQSVRRVEPTNLKDPRPDFSLLAGGPGSFNSKDIQDKIQQIQSVVNFNSHVKTFASSVAPAVGIVAESESARNLGSEDLSDDDLFEDAIMAGEWDDIPQTQTQSQQSQTQIQQHQQQDTDTYTPSKKHQRKKHRKHRKRKNRHGSNSDVHTTQESQSQSQSQSQTHSRTNTDDTVSTLPFEKPLGGWRHGRVMAPNVVSDLRSENFMKGEWDDTPHTQQQQQQTQQPQDDTIEEKPRKKRVRKHRNRRYRKHKKYEPTAEIFGAMKDSEMERRQYRDGEVEDVAPVKRHGKSRSKKPTNAASDDIIPDYLSSRAQSLHPAKAFASAGASAEDIEFQPGTKRKPSALYEALHQEEPQHRQSSRWSELAKAAYVRANHHLSSLMGGSLFGGVMTRNDEFKPQSGDNLENAWRGMADQFKQNLNGLKDSKVSSLRSKHNPHYPSTDELTSADELGDNLESTDLDYSEESVDLDSEDILDDDLDSSDEISSAEKYEYADDLLTDNDAAAELEADEVFQPAVSGNQFPKRVGEKGKVIGEWKSDRKSRSG